MNIVIIILVVSAVVIIGLFALRRFESMRNKSNDELRAILRGSEWLYYRNAILELQRRGEDIKPEVMPVLDLLISDIKQQRIGGWLILKQLYPELASRVPDYKPEEPQDTCKEKIQEIIGSCG